MSLLLLLSCLGREEPVLVPPAPPPAPVVAPGTTEGPALVEPVAPPGHPFPYDFAPLDLDGGTVPLLRWQGQPVLINLWATWCGPCIEELPALVELYAEWQPRGLVMLGIAVEDLPAKVKATAQARGMGWTLLQSSAGPTSQAFQADTLPVTLVYGRDGKLLYKHLGVVKADDPELRQALAWALR